MLTFTGYYLINRRARSTTPISPMEWMCGVTLFAGLFITPIALATSSLDDYRQLAGADWLYLLFVAVVVGIVGHTMMSWAHRFIPAARSSLILLAMNIVAIAAAWPIHDEPVTLVQAAGGIVVLIAVAAVLSRPASVRLVPVRPDGRSTACRGADAAAVGDDASDGAPRVRRPATGRSSRRAAWRRSATRSPVRAAGVSGVLVPQIFAPPWAALGAAAACDEDIELASGIAMAFVRSPLETAMAALDLDRLSGGRFTLGLGSSVRAWNVDRFGVDYDRPVARLRELVGLVKRMVTLDEQPTIGRFEGEFWHVDLDGIRLPRPTGRRCRSRSPRCGRR